MLLKIIKVGLSIFRSANTRANKGIDVIELGTSSEDDDSDPAPPSRPTNFQRKIFHALISECANKVIDVVELGQSSDDDDSENDKENGRMKETHVSASVTGDHVRHNYQRRRFHYLINEHTC